MVLPGVGFGSITEEGATELLADGPQLCFISRKAFQDVLHCCFFALQLELLGLDESFKQSCKKVLVKECNAIAC